MESRFDSDRCNTEITEVKNDRGMVTGITIETDTHRYRGYYFSADQALIKIDQRMTSLKWGEGGTNTAFIGGWVCLFLTGCLNVLTVCTHPESIDWLHYAVAYVALITNIGVGHYIGRSIEEDIEATNSVMEAIKEYRLKRPLSGQSTEE